MSDLSTNTKFSGHETFALRCAWLPKLAAALNDPVQRHLVSNDDDAIVLFGVGKNMAKAMRFWGQASAMVEPSEEGGLRLTEVGFQVLSEDGYDPYLGDEQTLWLIHWMLSTSLCPLYIWPFIINEWQEPDFTISSVVSAIQRHTRQQGLKIADASIKSMLAVFLNTYIKSHKRKDTVSEDILDSPLSSLDYIRHVGERPDLIGKIESVYSFNRQNKPEVSNQLFYYCLLHFWKRYAFQEKTLSFGEIAYYPGSPGQVFKLPDEDLRKRLNTIEEFSRGCVAYSDSSLIQVIELKKTISNKLISEALRYIYED
jgi:hypothetical protein